MSTPKQQVIDKCKQVIVLAQELYGVDISKCDIRFDLKGRSAGQAGYSGIRGVPSSYKFYVRFNTDLLTRELDEVINNVVPHELAHTVCQMDPTRGRGHDIGWYKVCKALGGTGTTRHSMPVVLGKGNTYEYTTTNGNIVRVGDKHHIQTQAGETFNFRRGKGSIDKTCAYVIVGCAGKTLEDSTMQKTNTTLTTSKSISPNPTFHIGAPEVTKKVSKVTTANPSNSKASISRKIMLDGHEAGNTYEEIIAAMMAANGYTRQLARATYTANATKVGIPL